MKIEFIHHSDARRLILIFAGWAMDAAPFRGLTRPGYDIAIVWDYRSLNSVGTLVCGYDEICIVAWSFGVFASTLCTSDIEDQVTKRIAVNGTLYPIDDLKGIPTAVFKGTLDGLNERTLYKFYRRMSTSRKSFEAFASNMPKRDIDELKDELSVFLTLQSTSHSEASRWDAAIIGRHDAIFPAEAQLRAWAGVPVETTDDGHLPDFDRIIDRYIIDKQRVGERFGRRRDSYDRAAEVQSRIVDRLCSMLEKHKVPQHLAIDEAQCLEIGCGSGMLSRRLAASMPQGAHLQLWDISGASPIESPGISFCRCDAELAIMHSQASSFDLIATASTVQWFNSLTRFLQECARTLKPGAWLAIATFADGNLRQVAEATGRSLPLLSLRQWLGIMPDTLEAVDTDEYEDTLAFGSAIDVFRHLRATGVNSLGSDNDSSLRQTISAFRPDPDGVFRATYRPLLMLMRRK